MSDIVTFSKPQIDLIKRVEDIDRFWSKVTIGHPDECWRWQGTVADNGYGHFWSAGRTRGAHRVSAALVLGPRSGMVLHSCDNPTCVNPNHLRWGTAADNAADCKARGRHTHGERSRSHLTADDVREMRRLYAAGGVTYKQLAERFGIVTATAHRIISRKVWRHVA